MLKQLAKAYAGAVSNLQILVENYLEYLSDSTEFRPIPGNVRVRLEDEDWTFNAYAQKTDQGYVIAVNAGIIPHLLQPIVAALKLGCIPEVSNRDELARWLMNTALEFLIFHELGHIELAHLDYLEKTRWNELDVESTEPSDLDTHVAIELMADEFAAAAVANRYLNLRFDARGGIPELSNSVVYGNALLFAIGVLFLVMTPAEKLATFAATTHPHPELRLGIVMALLWHGRPAPDRNVSRRTMSDLAQVPAILGVPSDSFLGLYWCDDPERKVDIAAHNNLDKMFQQNAAAVNRMRPRIDLIRANLAARVQPPPIARNYRM